MSNNLKNFNYIEHYNKDAELFDYFEERTGATEDDERRVREYIISKIPKSASNILDVGCGSAWAAAYFTKKNVKVTSLDVSIANPQKALALYTSPLHTAVTADSFKLPVKDNSYDYVIASEIIEHVVDPQAFINELYRVVKPGGSLIVTTPYKEQLRYYLCVHCNQKTPVHAHIHSFDEHKLREYAPSRSKAKFHFETFGNKLLIFLRTYVLLKYFPFSIWRIKDKAANFFYNKPAHIIAVYGK